MGAEDPFKSDRPEWALALQALGWLIITAGALGTGGLFALAPGTPQGMLVLVPLAIALASSAWWIGSILLVIAQSARRNVPPPRRRLWARILLRIGGLLCISIPSAFYGVLPAGLQVSRLMRSDVDPSLPISPIDPELLTMTLIVGGPPFVIGLALVIPALICGRRPPAPDLPTVFS
jgi:hypothetical protein